VKYEKDIQYTKKGQSESDAHFSLHDIVTTKITKKTVIFWADLIGLSNIDKPVTLAYVAFGTQCLQIR